MGINNEVSEGRVLNENGMRKNCMTVYIVSYGSLFEGSTKEVFKHCRNEANLLGVIFL